MPRPSKMGKQLERNNNMEAIKSTSVLISGMALGNVLYKALNLREDTTRLIIESEVNDPILDIEEYGPTGIHLYSLHITPELQGKLSLACGGSCVRKFRIDIDINSVSKVTLEGFGTTDLKEFPWSKVGTEKLGEKFKDKPSDLCVSGGVVDVSGGMRDVTSFASKGEFRQFEVNEPKEESRAQWVKHTEELKARYTSHKATDCDEPSKSRTAMRKPCGGNKAKHLYSCTPIDPLDWNN